MKSGKKDNNIDNLNRVGWAIGSITFSKIGNRADEDEFFIAALKSLLQTCNIKTEKNDKAIVASLIIFLISQFTNFFEKNKKFFLTVIHKIFEFMDEEHEGIKDMACEAFENICRKRPREFYVARKESEIFIFYMLRNLSNITRNLELYQKRSVLKSICCVIQNKAEVLNFQFRHRDTNNPGEEQENLRMAREINFLNTYLTKMGVSQNSSVKAYSHYFKTCEILYSTFPNSLINNASNFGNEESITPNFSYDSLKNIEAGNTECQYKYSVENKIIIPPVFNLYGIIKNTNYDQCLRADMIECFISIIRSIPKINSVATQLKNEFMKSCFIASLGVASDFPATKEFLLLDLVTEMVKISFSLEFMKSPIEKNCLYSNNENERANQALNDFHCEDNYRVLDDFILKNILPQIDDIADVDFAYSYLNLMISIFDNRYDMFFPLFSADEELFEKCYNHILSALLMKENIREKATELLIIICRKSYQTKNYLFFKKFYFTTLDNIFGIIFENHYKSATELLTILLSYRHTLEPVLGISVDKHIGELISSFSNVPGDYQTTFREGLFLLLGNDQLFSDHVSDFRKRVQIIENCDEIDDEKRLLEMRTRCCSQNKLNIGKFQ
ncbi:Protein EXPORTIN 1B [Dictyocoela roeselum]|nr:Protein EXPORTIN 1B [Dictyocoela roeselum]